MQLLHLAARIPAEMNPSDVPGAKALSGEKSKKRGQQRRVAAKGRAEAAVLTERKFPAHGTEHSRVSGGDGRFGRYVRSPCHRAKLFHFPTSRNTSRERETEN